MLLFLWAVSLSLSVREAVADEFLADRKFPPSTRFAASPVGTILTLSGNSFQLWSEGGKLVRTCELSDPRLQGLPHTAALRGDLVLLSFFEPEAGLEEKRKLVIVDVGNCRVVASFSLPGVVLGTRAARDGWLVVSHDMATSEYLYSMVDDEGREITKYRVPEANQESLTAQGLPAGPESLVPFRDRTVMVTRGIYELWYPAQKSRSARKIPMPQCLSLQGRWLTGAESDQELRRRVAHASEETRRIIEDFLKKGGSHRGFMAPVAGVSVFQDRLAVLLNDRSIPEGCRLDIWDLSLEAPLVIMPWDACPTPFFALVRDGLWVVRGDRLVKVPVDIPQSALGQPCEVLTNLRNRREQARP